MCPVQNPAQPRTLICIAAAPAASGGGVQLARASARHGELCAALGDLGMMDRFIDLSNVVEHCAEQRLVPLGTCGHSPAAESTAQAAAQATVHLSSCNERG